MKHHLLRIAALALCLIAPLGFAAQARAETSGTVTFTGEVVPSSLTMTLNAGSFSFGQIDSGGDRYNPLTSPTQPFPVSGGAASGVPNGMAWFTRTPLELTVSTPVTAVATICITVQTNVIDSGGSRLYMPVSNPALGGSDALSYLTGRDVPLCSAGALNGAFFNIGADQEYHLYPAYLVRFTDPPATFSATVLYTVSGL
jgi:hypothetical protein